MDRLGIEEQTIEIKQKSCGWGTIELAQHVEEAVGLIRLNRSCGFEPVR